MNKSVVDIICICKQITSVLKYQFFIFSVYLLFCTNFRGSDSLLFNKISLIMHYVVLVLAG